MYHKPYKKLPAEVTRLTTSCDVVFCQGFGPMTDFLRKKGCRDIRYVPAPTDEWRFGRIRSVSDEIVFDVVMVGNYIYSKLPWRTMPGSKWRKELSILLYRKLGSRFASFGNGWKGPYAAGPIPFDRQADAYHKSRIALGVNNLHARYFFSNRLPIAMSSGITVVHNYELGFEELFDPQSGCFFFRDTSEAWQIIKTLLEKDQTELDKIGLMARDFAVKHFNVINIMKYMINVLKSRCTKKENAGTVVDKENPWLKKQQSVRAFS